MEEYKFVMVYRAKKGNGEHISYAEVGGTDLESARNYAEIRACDIEEWSGRRVEYFNVVPVEDFDKRRKSEDITKVLEHYLADKSDLTFRKPYEPRALPSPGEA